jgi:hypothetical protein
MWPNICGHCANLWLRLKRMLAENRLSSIDVLTKVVFFGTVLVLNLSLQVYEAWGFNGIYIFFFS